MPGTSVMRLRKTILVAAINGDDFASTVNDHILAGAALPRLPDEDRPGMSAPCRTSPSPPRSPPAS
jgi:hypothetical protein